MTKTSVQLREFSTTATAAASDSESGLCSLFATIPPERIGLNGEYDHHGLVKRVWQALRVRFSARDLEKLRVMQRGKVVIFLGSVASLEVLKHFVSIAREIEGAIDVETHGVRIK
ncbi:phospholipid-binding protein [Leptolyngbya sp. DQ-M1]|uniref:hypothetical protein n=1 Tax=Leptolyngbya sp. DQ-M1 TaxID=2933920 RepID=UPI0032978B74